MCLTYCRISGGTIRAGTALFTALATLLVATNAGLAADQPVTIKFGLTVAGKSVGCGAPLSGLGSGHVNASLNDARFYVYDVSLVGADGKRTPVKLDRNDWQYGGAALLDFKDARGGKQPCSDKQPAKNTTVIGSVSSGAYSGLEFSVGLPVEGLQDGVKVSLNHSNIDTAPPPLDIAAMNWSWQAGRRFLVIEVNPVGGLKRADGTPARTWMVHLGSTGCKGNPATGEIVSCAKPNRFTVAFDRFDVQKDVVALDLAELFKTSDLSVDKGEAIGCMSNPVDPECVAIFAAFGLNLNDTSPGAGDGGQPVHPSKSPIFTVRRKP